jgi:hypothetical protein
MEKLKNWIRIPEKKKTEIFNQTGIKSGLSSTAIEKDWWVTLVLKTVFSLSFSEHILFKGGTSLSKGWGLIERFSEDIDLSIDRSFFGFERDLSRTQIQKLRKTSCRFINEEFVTLLKNKFDDMGIDDVEFISTDMNYSDKDPVIIEIYYKSITDVSPYLKPRIILEIGSRSLTEPFEKRQIRSLVSEVFENYDFSDEAVQIPIVLPKRTFIEKILLLHEEFQKPTDKIRTERLSRHLYDIEKIMDTAHGKDALADSELFNSIVAHRLHFNAVKGIDYSNHRFDKISFIPPEEVIGKWEKDYEKMRESMIYGESLPFKELIKKLQHLQEKMRNIK